MLNKRQPHNHSARSVPTVKPSAKPSGDWCKASIGAVIGVALAITLSLPSAMLSMSLAAPPEGWQPIDQGVGDLDPLGISQRQVSVGLRNNGEQTSLFQVTTPGPRSGLEQTAQYRIGPGFRVRVERMEYLVVDREGKIQFNQAPGEDGRFLEMVGANAVYELSPEPMLPQPILFEPSEALISGRLDHAGASSGGAMPMASGQINARLDGRVSGRLE